MRAFLAVALFLCPLVACGGNGDDGGDDEPPKCVDGTDNCIDQDCLKEGLPDTTLTGRVFAPNGTLPLYGINVYIPSETPGPFPEGAQCSRCTDPLLGRPITQTQTDDNGRFSLINVPVGKDIPLVVTSGKWRRQIKISNVPRCMATAIPETETKLPSSRAEGDIPKIAITTGDADSLECLVRKLGVADSEISTKAKDGRIQLYRGDGTPGFKTGFPGDSGPLPAAVDFWNDPAGLKTYDIVFLSCEGSQMANGDGGTDKTPQMLSNMKGYADLGGRVFASHWHNIWLGGNTQGNPALAPPVWPTVSSFRNGDSGNPSVDVIDQGSHPKATAFTQWMLNVGGSIDRGIIPLVANTGRSTVISMDSTKAEQWVFAQNSNAPQMFQFTTPVEQVTSERCGKVVFSDMHVSGGPDLSGGKQYPDSCSGGADNKTLSQQEKALAFMFFDIASCVGGVF